MNHVHLAIFKHIREAASTKGGAEASHFAALTDEQLVRMMFANYRGRDKEARGMRLTNYGLQVMASYFTAYEVAMPEGHTIRSLELLYLDSRATLPYYCSDKKVVVFESELCFKLKLVDGDIGTLIEIEAA